MRIWDAGRIDKRIPAGGTVRGGKESLEAAGSNEERDSKMFYQPGAFLVKV